MARSRSVLFDMSSARPTSETQISVSGGELFLMFTAIYPVAYLISLLMSQKPINLTSCFLQTHVTAMSSISGNGSMILWGRQKLISAFKLPFGWPNN